MFKFSTFICVLGLVGAAYTGFAMQINCQLFQQSTSLGEGGEVHYDDIAYMNDAATSVEVCLNKCETYGTMNIAPYADDYLTLSYTCVYEGKVEKDVTIKEAP